MDVSDASNYNIENGAHQKKKKIYSVSENLLHFAFFVVFLVFYPPQPNEVSNQEIFS
jgi:hypothetical protein